MGSTFYMHLTESNFILFLFKSRLSYLKIAFGAFVRFDEYNYFQAKYLNKYHTFFTSYVIDIMESPLDRSRFHILTSLFADRSALKIFH